MKMKKFTILLTSIIAMSMMVNAQSQRSVNSQTDKQHETGLDQVKWQQSGWAGLELLKKTNPSHPESLSWKWDTITCYNDQDALLERLTQTFDINGNVLTQLIEQRSTGAWVNRYRSTYTYNIYGKVQYIITESWKSSAWVNYTQLSVARDTSGNITRETVKTWYNGVWWNYVRRTYTYDLTGNSFTSVQEYWQSEEWVYDIRSTYLYDLSGNIHTITIEYSNSGGPWQFGARYTYTCDLNGNWLELLYEEWQTDNWVVGGKATYTNDINGNILTELFMNWQDGAWVNDSKKTYTYDINGNAISGKNEKWQDGGWQPDMQTAYIYHIQDIICVLNIQVYRYEVKYRSFVSGTAGLTHSKRFFTAYPNPAIDIITVNIDRNSHEIPALNIYNALGKLVKTEMLNQNQSQIDIGDLVNGIYVVTVKSNDRSATQKLTIQR